MKKSVAFTVYGNPKPWTRAGTMSKVKRKDGTIKHLNSPIHFDRNDPTWTQAVRMAGEEHRLPELLTGPLSMSIRFYLQRPKSKPKRIEYPDVKPDLDNLGKLIKDLLEGLIYKNDSQICEMKIYKQYAEEAPQANIWIGQM